MIIKVYQADLIPVVHDGEQEIVSVLMRDERTTPRNFRCNNCGKVICQVEGSPALISDDAAVPKHKNYIDIMCHRCKIIYRFVL